ncbi:CDP-glycerol glycerophosphotransferase family protein (plasmid) [Clostridium perfringens]
MNIKRFERLTAKKLINISYKISKIFPVKNKITFATYRTTELDGNFKFIYNKINEDNLDYKCNMLFKKYNSSLLGKADYLLHMISAGYHMATSKFFIIDDYYFPVYAIKPRKENKFIQVWHACGAFKKFGYSVIGKGYGASDDYIEDIPIHSNYDVVLVSSKEVIPYYAEAFNMDAGKILPIGVPRTDIFFDMEEKYRIEKNFFDKYPDLKNKKIILYAPTFRGRGQTTVSFDMTLDFDMISKNLKEDEVMVLKMHPFVKARIDSKWRNIIDLSDSMDINELMIMSDLLITDYSSVVFEFSLMDKPIIMYSPDREEYIKERDFYYEYEEFVPGPIVNNTKELISKLNSDGWDTKKVSKFKEKFFDYRDGKSTERFVNLLKSME